MKIALTLAALALALAAPAQAEYSWVADESASICNSLYLQSEIGGGWVTSEISMLQLTQDIGRAEAVAGIAQAAAGYCPEYASAVPRR